MRMLGWRFLFFFFVLYFSTSEPAQSRIVTIGDSHMAGSFGERLHARLRAIKPGVAIESHGLSGASPSHYFNEDPARRRLSFGYVERKGAQTRSVPHGQTATAPFARTLIAASYDLFILEFGDNMANYKGAFSGAAIRAQVERAMKEVTASRDYHPDACIWISPTHGEKRAPYEKNPERLQTLIAEIRRALGGRCRLIDSSALPGLVQGQVRTTDGLHLTREWAQRWADAVLAELRLLGLVR
jgi:hypothetical protein